MSTEATDRLLNRVARVRALASAGLTAAAIGVSMGKRASWVREIAAAHDIEIKGVVPTLPPSPSSVPSLALVDTSHPAALPARVALCPLLFRCEDAWVDTLHKQGRSVVADASCPRTCAMVGRVGA